VVAHEDGLGLAVVVDVAMFATRGEHGLVCADLVDDLCADEGEFRGCGLGVDVVVVVALEGGVGGFPGVNGLVQRRVWWLFVVVVRGAEVLLEQGDGVAEAEGKREEEVPDGAALADVGFVALMNDVMPV